MPGHVITIDGPAGTGKSTVARRLANELGFAFLDTGAMYRAVAAACLRQSIDPTDSKSVARVTAGMDPLQDTADAADLRSVPVTQAASLVAQHTRVRETLTGWQRAYAAARDVVTEGRDQGTVVFPDATLKVFLTATAEERADRRVRELRATGQTVDASDVLRQIKERDRRDETRPIAPLKPAADAVTVDTTTMTMDAVVASLRSLAETTLQRGVAAGRTNGGSS